MVVYFFSSRYLFYLIHCLLDFPVFSNYRHKVVGEYHWQKNVVLKFEVDGRSFTYKRKSSGLKAGP